MMNTPKPTISTDADSVSERRVRTLLAYRKIADDTLVHHQLSDVLSVYTTPALVVYISDDVQNNIGKRDITLILNHQQHTGTQSNTIVAVSITKRSRSLLRDKAFQFIPQRLLEFDHLYHMSIPHYSVVKPESVDDICRKYGALCMSAWPRIFVDDPQMIVLGITKPGTLVFDASNYMYYVVVE